MKKRGQGPKIVSRMPPFQNHFPGQARLQNCRKSKKAMSGAFPDFSWKSQFRIEGVLLFAHGRLLRCCQGPSKISLAGTQGPELCTRAGETRVFVKNMRLACTRALFPCGLNRVLAPGRLPHNLAAIFYSFFHFCRKFAIWCLSKVAPFKGKKAFCSSVDGPRTLPSRSARWRISRVFVFADFPNWADFP